MELLICHPRPYLFSSSGLAITRLFKLCSKAAEGLGKKELSAAYDLQAIMVAKWKDWDKVFSKLEKTSSAGFVALADRFFVQWKNFTAAKSEKYVHGPDWHAEWSWVPILADEARTKRPSSRRFLKSLRGWLNEAGQSPENMKRVRYSLERLTLDLNRGSAVRKSSPTLHRMLSSGYGGGDLLDQSRKRWLKRLDAQGLFPDAMAVWKKGIVHLIPDPASSHKSSYDHHAEWLKVLYELNRTEYDRLVKEWRDIHRRRLNLWKAVSVQGLPIPGKK